jgi:hypothetical protein
MTRTVWFGIALEDGIDEVVRVERFIGTDKERENIPYD